MSYSKKTVSDPFTVSRVIELYRTGDLTMQDISDRLDVSMSNVHQIIKITLPAVERRDLKRQNYSESKLGAKNPALGRQPGNYIGHCSDGHGYKTMVVDKKREFVHRIEMADAICIKVADLPSSLHVHHIDGNKTNNSLNNLALVTASGHATIHRLSLPKIRKKPKA